MKLLGRGGKRGMPGKVKLALEFVIAGIVLGYLLYWSDVTYDGSLYLPFVSTAKFQLVLPKWVYLPFAMVVVVGTSQAVNLTDGLDGLAIGPVIVASGTFLVLAYASGTVLQYWDHTGGMVVLHKFDIADYLRIPKVTGVQEVAIFLGALCGSGIGFLWYNTYPAQVFMGDVGALALGGALGSVAVLTKHELLMPIVGGIFVLEAISVITQTTSYKLTGKRVFKMAPIHHHFELKGWAEPKIIVRFWIISILLALVGIASLKLR
jgi:phospho-N-acetylmuramoyl-pentapeptide-transferase